METLPNGVTLRDFYDPPTTRAEILRRVREGYLSRFPIENDTTRIDLLNADYDPNKLNHSLEAYEKALMTGGRLSVPLRGTMRLTDKLTGKHLEEKEGVLANVPYLTDDGTFVVGGNMITTTNQSRLKPGIYARRKDNGELESHINVKSGTGSQMRLFMEPETGVYRIQADKANIKLYPILKELGVPDEQLQGAWGDKILKANQAAYDKQAFGKFYTRLLHSKARLEATDDEKRGEILTQLGKTVFDPEVNTRTLGKPHATLSPEALVDASHKLLKVNRYEEPPDDRDHPANRTFHSVDDFFGDRVAKDAGGLGRNLLYRATYDRSLKHFRPGYFTPQLEGLVVGNQLSQPVPGINPVEIMDQQRRVIQLGEGGISDMRSIPMSCYSEDTEVFTSSGWVLWSKVSSDTKFGCRIDGRLEFHNPTGLFSYRYSGEMFGIDTVFSLLVTPNHRHWVRKYRAGSGLKRCGLAEWGFELASQTHRKPREFYIGHDPFEPASISDTIKIGRHSFDVGDFAEFIGWYVAEGHWDIYSFQKFKKYRICISQDKIANPTKVARIKALLERMGLKASYTGHNFVFNSKDLFLWIGDHCGTCSAEKRFPEMIFHLPSWARERAMDGLVLGDGHRYPTGHEVFHTTSPSLRDQSVRLWILNGKAAGDRKLYDRPGKPEHYAQPYSTSMLTDKIRGVTSEQRYDDCYSVQNYDGMVYCAEVPGGLLLTRRAGSYPVWSGNSRNVHPGQLGLIDPIRSSESRAIGVDQRFAIAARKGSDNNIYFPLRNRKTGKVEYLNPTQLQHKIVAFPQADSLEPHKTPLPLPSPTSAVDLLDVKKKAGFGIPDRSYYGDTESMKPGDVMDYHVQRHAAERAGLHRDLRIGDHRGLHSWAVPTDIPEPGGKALAIRQPMHSPDYLGWEGQIPSGQYGGGHVRSQDLGKILITKSEPDKISFVTAHKKYPEHFSLIRSRNTGGHQEPWLLINTTPTDPVKLLGSPDHYRKIKIKSVPSENAESAIDGMVEGKVDGAAALFKLNPHSIDVVSHRISATGRPIIHTHRFFGGDNSIEIPHAWHGKVLRGEIYAEKNGRPQLPQTLTPLLNSSVAKSLEDQRHRGLNLRAALYGVAGEEHLYPMDRHNKLQEALDFLPKNKFTRPPVAMGREAGLKLWKEIAAGRHPHIHEGVVIYPDEGSPIKAKLRPERDVIVKGVYPGEQNGKYRDIAGGIEYALPEDPDRIVGRVGTGFDDDFRKWMWENRGDLHGRTARISATQHLPSGAHFQPSFISLHEDLPLGADPLESKQACDLLDFSALQRILS